MFALNLHANDRSAHRRSCANIRKYINHTRGPDDALCCKCVRHAERTKVTESWLVAANRNSVSCLIVWHGRMSPCWMSPGGEHLIIYQFKTNMECQWVEWKWCQCVRAYVCVVGGIRFMQSRYSRFEIAIKIAPNSKMQMSWTHQARRTLSTQRTSQMRCFYSNTEL